MISRMLKAALADAARSYVGGEDLEEALATIEMLRARGPLTFTLGYWNRAGDDPEEIVEHYADTVRTLADVAGSPRVAIKAPAFHYRDDLLARLRGYTPRNVELHFDSHQIETQDATLAIAEGANGITLPSRWKRSVKDARRVASAAHSVRIVKGQFAAAPELEGDPRAGFLSIARELAGRQRRVFVATHDVPLAREALKILVSSGTPCELELLYGLPPQPSLEVAIEMRIPIRVYVPWGTAYLPYAAAKVFRQPQSMAWLLRDLVLGRRTWPALAMAPR